MEVRALRVADSPRGLKLHRLSVEVESSRWLARPERVWFDVPSDLSSQLSRSGDPWLAAVLPLAVSNHEAIRMVDLAVDPTLLSNLHQVMEIWHGWYPELLPVSIDAEVIAPRPDLRGSRTAAFFSGGVDSFYTVLCDQDQDHPSIDELLFLHGFDIPIGSRGGFEQAHASALRAASSMGLPIRVIATNLRETRLGTTDWTYLANGAALASAGLTLEPRYTRILIPSTGRYQTDLPLGTHPETDPLFSTSQLSFIHHGTWANRISKIGRISEHPSAIENLRVCWESKDGGNCGRCSKCLRTMATLEVYGRLQACKAFPPCASLPTALSRLYLAHERPFMIEVREFAIERQRDDIRDAIDAAILRTERMERWLLLGLVQGMRRRLGRIPTLRAISRRPAQWVRRVAIKINRRLP